jgi:hypothetical protein
MSYYVLDIQTLDANWTGTLIMLIIIFSTMISIWYTQKFAYVSKHWDQIKCQPEYTAFAFLYGQSTGKTLDSCYRVKNTSNSVLESSLSKMSKNVEETSTEVSNTAKQIMDLSGQLQKLDQEIKNPGEDETATNLVVSAQNNLQVAKQGLQKIIASLIIQANVNNGMISVAKSIQPTTTTDTTNYAERNPDVKSSTQPVVSYPDKNMNYAEKV